MITQGTEKAVELYALFHVHRVTGESHRYPRRAFPADNKTAVEAAALRSRQADAAAGNPDSWETQARPDTV